jgi:hypothetical protein
MLKAGELERTGSGKRGDAFRYKPALELFEGLRTNSDLSSESSSSSLLLSSSYSLVSQAGHESAKTSGHESTKIEKTLANTNGIQVPKKRDTNGTPMDTNLEITASGHESDYWEKISPMKHAETLFLEVEVLDDGALRARRKDRKPLTHADREEARRVVDSLPGITVEDVMRVWPGARVVSKT